MRFDVITLFPEMIQSFIEQGVTRRAYDSGHMVLKCWKPAKSLKSSKALTLAKLTKLGLPQFQLIKSG